MRKIKITWRDRLSRLFKPKLKPYLVDEKYKVIPAFKIGGVDYWMYDSALEIPTGRYMAAMGVHIELESNCDKEYLTSHVKAMEKLLNPLPGKPIQLTWVAQINKNLEERLTLLPAEDAIYKFASIIFFDESESKYSYDYDYNKIKIEKWKAAGGTLDFFSKTPIRELLPVLTLPDRDMQTYLTVRRMVEEVHHKVLIDILSEDS